MLLKDFLPHPSVSQFVRLYRIVHFSFDNNLTSFPVKAYAPRPEQILAFFPYDTEKAEYKISKRKMDHFRTTLTGQQLEVINRAVARNILVIQIVFQPSGLYQLLGIPSYELTNQYIDAELVLTSDINFVNEQLYHAKSYDEMLKVAHNFVLSLIRKRAKDSHPLDRISKIILRQDSRFSIDLLARESCCSHKQFERKFKERVGVTPKLFSRVTRFDKAFILKNKQPHLDWLTIAIQCGYYDYQHLVRDYKEFTGCSPTAFYEIENKSPERSLGLSEAWYRYAIEDQTFD